MCVSDAVNLSWTAVVFDICTYQTCSVFTEFIKTTVLPELWHFKAMDWDQTPVRQIQWIWETCWHLPVLALSPIFLLSISSLALIRGTIILHSSSRFKQTLSNAFHPSSSPSLTHIHKSLPFSFAHKCTSPLTHLYQTSQVLCVCQGVFLPWTGTHLLLTIKKYCGPLY